MLNLSKGQSLSLEKEGKPLTKVIAGLGWDPAQEGEEIDVDLWVLPRNAAEEPTFYGNYKGAHTPGVSYSGDDRTGESSDGGADETMTLDIPSMKDGDYAVVANIYDGGDDFGSIKECFANVVNAENNEELARFTMTEDGKGNNSIILAHVSVAGGKATFKAVGKYVKVNDMNDLAGNRESMFA